MSHKNKYRQGRRSQNQDEICIKLEEAELQNEEEMDESKAKCLAAFRGFQEELDRRYDLAERLVKKSRDVTIESKRIIFLLHRLTKNDKSNVLEEASKRLTELREKNLRAIAEEVRNQDNFQFLNSYSPGLEEFIEALSYHHYLKEGKLISWDNIQQLLVFPKSGDESVSLFVSPSVYMLGLADLSGELMRRCINDVGAGDLQSPFQLRPFMRDILDGFVRMGNGPRELNNKLRVMYANVAKVDNACYAIHVRRREIPEYKLTDMTFVSQPMEPVDESYTDI